VTTKQLAWIAAAVVLSVLVVVSVRVHHSTSAPAAAAPPARQERKIAHWWDPMLGPSSITNHPGKSAMGMDLEPVYEDAASSGAGVRIDPRIEQNMGVKTAPVVRGSLPMTVRTVGMLQVPQPGLYDLTVRVGGYVEKLYADTDGMRVTQDQVLFDLYSPDVLVAEQELITATKSLAALDANASPEVRGDAHALVESARRKLALWDIDPQDIDAIASADRPPRTVPIRSPATGYLADKAVVAGSAVQPGMLVMRIEDHSTLWLDTQVYEGQLSLMKPGLPVRATVDAWPGKVFTGKITFLYPHLDHLTRTRTVRATLDNPNHELAPGMYASVEILLSPVPDVILVPREAVIDTGVKQIAFVVDPASPGHFLPRNVRTGLAGDNDQVQVLEGLSPGEQVVTSGQFLIDVESRTKEAVDKFLAGSSSSK